MAMIWRIETSTSLIPAPRPPLELSMKPTPPLRPRPLRSHNCTTTVWPPTGTLIWTLTPTPIYTKAVCALPLNSHRCVTTSSENLYRPSHHPDRVNSFRRFSITLRPVAPRLFPQFSVETSFPALANRPSPSRPAKPSTTARNQRNSVGARVSAIARPSLQSHRLLHGHRASGGRISLKRLHPRPKLMMSGILRLVNLQRSLRCLRM